MSPEKELEIAIRIATEAHEGQKRKRSGEDYITHPKAVADSLEDIDLKIIAWLHDVLEDNEEWTVDRLLANEISAKNIAAVLYLTKSKGQSYMQYIDQLMTNESAIKVKLADLTHNMMGLEDGPKKDKYLMAERILKSCAK